MGYSIPPDVMLSIQLVELAGERRSLLGEGLGIGFPGGEKIVLCITCFVYSSIVVSFSLQLLCY